MIQQSGYEDLPYIDPNTGFPALSISSILVSSFCPPEQDSVMGRLPIHRWTSGDLGHLGKCSGMHQRYKAVCHCKGLKNHWSEDGPLPQLPNGPMKRMKRFTTLLSVRVTISSNFNYFSHVMRTCEIWEEDNIISIETDKEKRPKTRYWQSPCFASIEVGPNEGARRSSSHIIFQRAKRNTGNNNMK